MKRIALAAIACIALAALLFFPLSGCATAGTSPNDPAKMLVGLAPDYRGLEDNSFNAACYDGIKEAQTVFGIIPLVKVPEDVDDLMPMLEELAGKARLVVVSSWLLSDVLLDVAQRFPKTTFLANECYSDSAPLPANIVNLRFSEEESGYLAGVVAGLLTKQYASALPNLNDANVLGIVAGMDIPPIQTYVAGFKAGVASVNPECKVLTEIAGNFVNPDIGRKLAEKLHKKGCDIIFGAAAATNNGIFEAARNHGFYAIGFDVDESFKAPDVIITSAIKNVAMSTFLSIKAYLNGKLPTGKSIFYGLKDKCTGLASFHDFDGKIPQGVKDAVKKAINDIVSGKVTVPKK